MDRSRLSHRASIQGGLGEASGAGRRAGALVVCVAWGVLLGAPGSPLSAQTGAPRTLAVAPCEGCRIRMTERVRLGRQSDSVGIDDAGSVALLEGVGYLVNSSAARGQVAVYDARGQFRQLLGRRGQGPGEFMTSLRFGFLREDSIMVVEGSSGRFALYSSDLVMRRTGRFFQGGVSDWIALSPELIVTSAPVRRGDSVHTLAVLSAEGDARRFFGSVSVARASSDAPIPGPALLTRGRVGFWRCEYARYRLELWSGDGRLMDALVRQAEWFRDTVTVGPGRRTFYPFPSRVSGIREDANGFVWVLATVMDDHWKPDAGLGPAPAPARIFDTIVEVIDVKQGRVLASTRVDQVLRFTEDGSAAYSMEEAPSGDSRLVIWDIDLERR